VHVASDIFAFSLKWLRLIDTYCTYIRDYLGGLTLIVSRG